ncbi:MAG TPA: SRPBCC family protein [Cyclobacteriaceae bacterium]
MKNLAHITKEKDGFRVMFERTLPFPIETVWLALTDPKKMAQWFTDVEMDFVVGGKMLIRFRDEAKTESFGKIVRIEPPHVFEYLWEEELASWQLFKEGDRACKLVLVYSKLPASYAMSVPAGWHVLLDQLEEVLGGASGPYPFGGPENERTKKIKEVYAELLSKQFPELKSTV